KAPRELNSARTVHPAAFDHPPGGSSMSQNVQTYTGYAGAGALSAQRQRVLRNTYWLLALSMVPTVRGAWVGVATGITSAMSPGIGLIVFLAGAFGFMFAIERTKNSAA